MASAGEPIYDAVGDPPLDVLYEEIAEAEGAPQGEQGQGAVRGTRPVRLLSGAEVAFGRTQWEVAADHRLPGGDAGQAAAEWAGQAGPGGGGGSQVGGPASGTPQWGGVLHVLLTPHLEGARGGTSHGPAEG